MVDRHVGPGLLIKYPLPHNRIFRVNRGRRERTSRGGFIFVKDARWFESADCRAVDCEAYAQGWTTMVDTSSELGQRQAHYIRKDSGRHFTEQRQGPEEIVVFQFYPEQKCFGDHTRPIERDPRFILRGRDHSKEVDYDEFFDTFNETTEQIRQSNREV